MVRLVGVIAIVVSSAGCGASTATQERQPERPSDAIAHAETRSEPPALVAVPENPTDRNIRRNLNVAISHDAELKDRQISFIVTKGDVSVTGIVRTEEERRRINDLAMNIDGVKSVANAVLLAE